MAPMSAGSVRCLSTEGGYCRLLYDSQAVCARSATPVVRNPTATAITEPITAINRLGPALIDHRLLVRQSRPRPASRQSYLDASSGAPPADPGRASRGGGK